MKKKTTKIKEIPTSKRGVPLTRACNTLTESQFFSRIRSALRSMSVRWLPRIRAIKAVERPYTGSNKRLKKEYRCGQCRNWFPRKEIEVNHIVEVGTLKCFNDLPGFVERLLCEEEGFEILCISCHQTQTNKQRRKCGKE